MLCLGKYINIKQFALVKFLIQQVSNFNLLAADVAVIDCA